MLAVRSASKGRHFSPTDRFPQKFAVLNLQVIADVKELRNPKTPWPGLRARPLKND